MDLSSRQTWKNADDEWASETEWHRLAQLGRAHCRIVSPGQEGHDREAHGLADSRRLDP
jgi:hypothetical protein